MADKDLSPDRVIASLLEGKSRREMMVILARLEHGGAGIYQSFAANERNEKARAALLAGAAREEQRGAELRAAQDDDASQRQVREVWQGASASGPGPVLFISMHLLPRLRR
jgi:hypothetical protein